MDVNRISELGVAGFVDPELSALVAKDSFDIGEFWSIGIAGPVSAELLRSIALAGSRTVADAVHSVIAGPVAPEELDAMLRQGVPEIVEAAFATGKAPFESGKALLAAVAARARS